MVKHWILAMPVPYRLLLLSSDTYHRAKKPTYPEHINAFRPEGFLPFPSAS